MAKSAVTLRAVNDSDLGLILKWANDPEVRRAMGTVYPIGDLEHKKYWTEQLTSGNIRSFMIDAGAPVGICSLRNFDHKSRKVELTIYIGEAGHRGKGLGAQALRHLLDFAFDELNMHRVYLYVIEHNESAIRFYEKAGFSHEGSDREAQYYEGRYWDSVRMGVLKDEYVKMRTLQDGTRE